MIIINFQEPFSDENMTYSATTHRYTLTEDFVREMGLIWGLGIETQKACLSLQKHHNLH